jgi:hypothetical protein
MYMVKYRHKPLDVRNTVINIKVCGKEEISWLDEELTNY